MKKAISDVTCDNGKDVNGDLVDDVEARLADGTAVFELDDYEDILDVGDNDGGKGTEDDLSDEDGLAGVDENVDKAGGGLDVGTYQGIKDVINTPVITMQRSSSPNELLGHKDNVKRITKDVSEMYNKRLKDIEDGNDSDIT